MLFEARKGSPDKTVVPATVDFKFDKKKGQLKPMSAEQKMFCALRKVLAKMSDQDPNRCRFYIDNNQVQILKAPVGSQVREGEPQTFRGSGRCKVGVCHPEGHKSSKIIEFDISFRDIKDDRGLADVEYFDPTTIDELPRTTRIA